MRRVHIEYIDLNGPVNSDWTALDKINRKPAKGEACGLLLHEDAENVTIILSALHEDDPKERTGFADFTIPRGCIVRMVDLVEAPPSKSAGGRSARPSRKGGRRSTGK
ncbi:MAG: hypothetical protein AB7P12_09705 [Alphaproteobacteria bacterium]